MKKKLKSLIQILKEFKSAGGRYAILDSGIRFWNDDEYYGEITNNMIKYFSTKEIDVTPIDGGTVHFLRKNSITYLFKNNWFEDEISIEKFGDSEFKI